MAVSIDGLTVEELRALDAYAQASVLNELLAEGKVLADNLIKQNNRVANAKILLGTARAYEVPELKREILDAQRNAQNIKILVGARKQQVSIMQTLLRAIPAS